MSAWPNEDLDFSAVLLFMALATDVQADAKFQTTHYFQTN